MKEVALPLLFNLSSSSLLVLLMIPISYALRFHITNSGEQSSLLSSIGLLSEEEEPNKKSRASASSMPSRGEPTGEGIFHATPFLLE